MRVATFQKHPVFDDVPAVASVIADDVRWAAARGAGLAVFPEAYLHGHSYHRATIAARARTLGDPEVLGLVKSLQGFDITVVVGMFARCANAVRNVALILRAGDVVGVYAKAHPNEPGVEAGTSMPVFEAAGSTFAVNICNDANFPALAERARAVGAGLLCYPLNNMLHPTTAELWRARSIDNLIARARETGCWVVSSDVVGAYGGQVSFGCTAIVDPAGGVRARVPEGEEGRIVFDSSTGSR